MSIAAELEKLQELHENGALSDEEFAEAKQAVLRRSHGNAPALAIASLVSACSTIVLGPPGAIFGILLGIFALREIKLSGNVAGKGLAMAGVLLGTIFLFVYLILGIVFLYAMTHWRD